ncbi:hypothetical protein GCM10011348_39200 [Marinobacterium nitratireducens]|uniref:Uncharacterized protein n=1 Tax=Marinobacterium nitratireducens TaxID=518897 RepID=A0A918DXC5_9GAMM|nr:hypothetical protein [Marinobacterium nitratireducens]GGO87010.1 hypothetical protein GCM10011348_39200 [Marinobacterium nitratireducens]
MRTLLSTILAVSLVLASLNAMPVRAESDDDDNMKAAGAAAAITAVIIGTMAIQAHKDRKDKKKHQDDHRYGHRYEQGRHGDRDHHYHGSYRYRHDDDRHRSNRPKQWHPKRGVTCYRNLRQCYQAGSGYSARWTRREFH